MDFNENLNPEEEKQEEQIVDTVVEEAEEQLPEVVEAAEDAVEEVMEEIVTEQAPEQMEEVPVVAEPSFEEEDEELIRICKKVSPYANSPYVMNHVVEETVKPKKVKKEKGRKGGFWKKAICAVLILAMIAGASVATGAAVNHYWEDRFEAMEDSFEDRMEDLQEQISNVNTGISTSGSPVTSQDGGLTPAQVYAMNVNSVVMIYNEVTVKYNGQVSVGTSTGSGFIISQDGYVVTNYHVVEGEGELTIVMTNGKEYAAKLIGCDETNDVALLKMEGEGFPAVVLGKSDDLIVGDQVVAIGNPLGELTSTLTVGYISAKERDVTTDGFAINMIQTDAAINSGNSGGPLFNMKGEVIGITTAKYSGTSGSGATIEGIGFAIPIDDVSGLISDLTTYGYITGAYLGVSVSDMDATAANYYGLPMGAYVQKVEQGYSAQRAGIQPKDIITSIGGIAVENVNDLTRALRNFKAGDLTVITIYRAGKEMNLHVTLDAKPVANQG